MSRQAIDPQAVLATLGVTDGSVIAPLSGGTNTAMWRIERRGVPFALRLFRADQVSTWQREVATMRAASAGGIPVPRVAGQGMWQERPALLLSWCAGRPLLDLVGDRPWRLWQLGVAFGRMQARIHRVPAPFDLTPDAHAWIGWAGRHHDALEARLRELSRHRPVLLHLDYHPLNVLAQGLRISAVLDWANARPGDRRADVARTLTILRLSPRYLGPGAGWRGPHDERPFLRVARWLLAASWRRGYEAEAGPLDEMAIFYAWAGAVMLHDLGPRDDRPGGPPGQLLEPVERWTAYWERRAGVDMG
jgi:aminoglycoside phosphotransferase (APT) family kinase protein